MAYLLVLIHVSYSRMMTFEICGICLPKDPDISVVQALLNSAQAVVLFITQTKTNRLIAGHFVSPVCISG